MKNKINYKININPTDSIFVQSVVYYKAHLINWMKIK